MLASALSRTPATLLARFETGPLLSQKNAGVGDRVVLGEQFSRAAGSPLSRRKWLA
jgi:hypothetical protein